MFDSTSFVERCEAIAASADAPERMKAFLEKSFAAPAEIATAFDNDISRQTNPAELSLHRDAALTVIRVVLDPGQRIPIPHDHRIWAFVAIYQGAEENTFYRREDGGQVAMSSVRTLQPGEVLAMAPGTVHAIANPGQVPTIGIHVYLGDLVKQERSMFHPESLREEPFEFARFFEYARQFGDHG